MFYVPQPIAVYPLQEMQGFRKGNCTPYENRILCSGTNHRFPNLMIKRLTEGATATVTVMTLDDSTHSVIVPTSQTNYSLDAGVDAYEMLVLGAGDWQMLSPLDGYCYLRIMSGSQTFYTDAIYLDHVGAETFPQCEESMWVKLTWTDGRYISADTSTDSITPVLAYPDTSQSFFMYLQGNLSQPEWETEEEGQKDAAGVFVATNRRVSKRWKLEGFPVSEAVIDALQASALFASVTVEFESLPAFTGIRDIKVVQKWENGGCFATYEYTFTTDYLLKQGCC